MSRSATPPAARNESAPPADRQVDRRAFLRRAAALGAAASSGALGSTLVAPAPASGASVSGGTGPALPDLPLPQEADPAFFTLAEAAAAIRRRDLSSAELVDACLARIARFDEALMAFNTVVADQARQAARAADAGPVRGALHGVPLAIKDNYFTAGVPTTANSHIFADFVPDYDAEAWARLKARGAILLGKTQMGPLATSRATTPDGRATTMNAWAPRDASVSPGGSSSGSATAVAARLALSSTGTQTGGSITNPSEAQGLTGLKPTMGRVSLRGIIPLTYTRDHPGPLARDAMDAAIMLSAMAGPDPADPRTLDQPRLPDLVMSATPVQRGGRTVVRWPTRIGVLPGYLDAPPADIAMLPSDASDEDRARWERQREGMARQGDTVAARRAMLDTFRDLGAQVVEVELPRDWETLTSGDFNNVRLPERAEPFLEVLRDDVRKFGVSLSPWINGLLLPGTAYLRGQRAKLLLLRRILDDLFADCDVVVQTSPVPFDIVGLPLIAFPVGLREGDTPTPLGAVFGGLPWAEDRLLSLVAAYQDVTDWHRRRPEDPVVDAAPAPGDRGRIDIWEVDAFGQ